MTRRTRSIYIKDWAWDVLHDQATANNKKIGAVIEDLIESNKTRTDTFRVYLNRLENWEDIPPMGPVKLLYNYCGRPTIRQFREIIVELQLRSNEWTIDYQPKAPDLGWFNRRR